MDDPSVSARDDPPDPPAHTAPEAGRWGAAWVAAMDEAARADQGLREAAAGRRVVIDQEVREGAARHRWHVVLDHGEVAVRPGPAEAADVSFSQDAEVAGAVARGEVAASTAFAMGRIRVGGDVAVLMELGPAIARLGDVFAPARAGGPDAGGGA